jgi:hypothetical protein
MGMFQKKIGLFISILLLILIAMNYWMDRELSPHYPLQYSEVFNPKVKANVIILGASHATHGINPKYLETDELKVYNFSLNGAGPSFNLKWYKKIFQPNYPQPQCVIYGVHWGMFDKGLLKRKIEQDSKYFPLRFLFSGFMDSKWFRNLETVKTLLLNRFAIIRGRKQLASRLFRGTREVYLVSRYYNGFIPYERRGRLNKKKDVKPQNSRGERRAFEKLLDEFKKNKIRVVFVHVPGYLPAQNVSNLYEGIQLLNKIAEERKILFLDYETKRVTNINTDPSMFSDWIHLNEKGSKAFSKLLNEDLRLVFRDMGYRTESNSPSYESRPRY